MSEGTPMTELCWADIKLRYWNLWCPWLILKELFAEIDLLRELNAELIDKMNHVHQVAALASSDAHETRIEVDRLRAKLSNELANSASAGTECKRRGEEVDRLRAENERSRLSIGFCSGSCRVEVSDE